MKHIEVVAAIIFFDSKILCMQRSASKYDYISYKYEFPGGKVEAKESQEEALKREIMEELHMNIHVEKQFLAVRHQYPDFYITMNSYLCTCSSTTLKPEVHIDYKWLSVNELLSLDWAAADIPIVMKLRDHFNESL